MVAGTGLNAQESSSRHVCLRLISKGNPRVAGGACSLLKVLTVVQPSEGCKLLKTRAWLWDAREGTCVYMGTGSTPAEQAKRSTCAVGLLCLFS